MALHFTWYAHTIPTTTKCFFLNQIPIVFWHIHELQMVSSFFSIGWTFFALAASRVAATIISTYFSNTQIFRDIFYSVSCAVNPNYLLSTRGTIRTLANSRPFYWNFFLLKILNVSELTIESHQWRSIDDSLYCSSSPSPSWFRTLLLSFSICVHTIVTSWSVFCNVFFLFLLPHMRHKWEESNAAYNKTKTKNQQQQQQNEQI